VLLVVFRDSFYVDPLNTCYIRIRKDSIDGNKKDVLAAVEHMRDTAINNYLYTCKYVNTVVLGKCLSASKTGPGVTSLATPACYLKGTKSVYINTAAENGDYSKEVIAKLIFKYAQASSSFWNNEPQ
jgi:hypothetical protein